MFHRRITVLSLILGLWALMPGNVAMASCSDRPGTPDQIRAEPISATAIRLHWRNTTNRAGGSNDMWFDISVRDGRNQQVGKDITGGARQNGVRYHRHSSHDFTGLRPDTEYRFQMRARTEGGTKGCVSGQPSGVATTRTPTPQLDQACGRYAGTALQQLATAKAMPASAPCPVDGPRWTGDRQQHYAWCLGIRAGAAMGGEQKAREDQLNVCRSRSKVAANSVRVLAYNIYMRPTSLFKNGQSIRAGLLPQFLNGYDAIIFSEAFDDDIRNKLLRLLRPAYPHATRTVGSDRGVEQDGGVIIVSRWPITAQKQRTFGKTCAGSDCKSDKGVLYALIDKSGKAFHIFGSHTQAWPTAEGARIRRQQFQIMKQFIDEQKIPAGEPVLIGGDLNVDMKKAKADYDEMLRTLNATHPPTSGHPYTFDPKSNKLASSGDSEFLDYVLYSNGHQKPRSATNEVLRLRTKKPWKEFFFEKDSFDLSDHYPVLGVFNF